MTGVIHASPSAYAIYKAGLQLHRGKGVLLVNNNFVGDCLNNDMAAELLEHDGVPVRRIEVHDNMASSDIRTERGGFCGMLLLLKIAKACALRGNSQDEIAHVVEKANNRLASISVTTDPLEKAIEFGRGFSGEAPLYTTGLIAPDEVAQRAMDDLLSDLQPQIGEKLYVLVNRLRMSSFFESFVMVNAVGNYLDQKNAQQDYRGQLSVHQSRTWLLFHNHGSGCGALRLSGA